MLDWTLLQSFVAVAESGSLSSASKAINGSQPTMSRHISTLEETLGVRLFDRSKSGMTLTKSGIELLSHTGKMADAASGISTLTREKPDGLTGTVRITASEIVATYMLPEILTQLHATEPKIQLEVIASDETNNLLRREADIAVRMYRPTQLDVITRKIGELKLGAYASKSYIERKGIPQSVSDIMHHDVIGYDRSTLIIDGFKNFGLDVDRDFFAFRSDNQVLCWQMVVAGYGIGFNQVRIGEKVANLVPIPLATNVGTMPIWLTAHNDLHKSLRVRRVYDFLAKSLVKLASQ